MKHALFIAFHFPPEASSSGVLRTLKYARYLSQFGWRVTVITLDRSAYEIVDCSLEEEVPDTVRVIRTRYLNTKKHLSLRGRYPVILAIPDRWIGWYPWAVRAGKEILRSDRPDLIYSTSPHATAHIIGQSLSKKGKVPWVADFRDPWYEDPPEPDTPVMRHWFARRLERRAVHWADRVIASTSQLRNMLASRYRDLSDEKFIYIPNGYDEADFTNRPSASVDSSEKFIVVHIGSINPDFRDPRPLFRATRKAIDQGKVDPSKLEFRFIGPGAFGESSQLKSCVKELGLSNNVVFRSRVPFNEALKELMSSSVALLLQASEDTVNLVPAKLYEYLRSQRPVVALVYPGAASQVIEETGGGWPVDPRDNDMLTKTLIGAYECWRTNELGEISADSNKLSKYNRQNLAGKLASEFDLLTQ